MNLAAALLFAFVLPLLAVNLRDAVAGKDLYIGSAANMGHLEADGTYRSTIHSQYNLITPENECKWGSIATSEGVYDFTQCDYVHAFALRAGQAFRGHNLCWGIYNPTWLTSGSYSASTKRTILTNYVKTVVSRYGNSLLAWDAVNEAISDSESVILKPNVWYPDVPDYIDLVFRTARAETTAKLFYNDYNIESMTGWMKTKSDKVYNMVRTMKEQGVPIDGVGFQLHVDINYLSMIQGVKDNMARLAALGLEIHMTEIDVACGSSTTACTAADLQLQANVYSELLQACLEQPACKSYESWGFTDKYTWLGTSAHPLPYDENYNPKPAHNSILSVLENAANRS